MDDKTQSELSKLEDELQDEELSPSLNKYLDDLDKAFHSNQSEIDGLIELLEPIARISHRGTGLELIINHLKKIEHELDKECSFIELIEN